MRLVVMGRHWDEALRSVPSTGEVLIPGRRSSAKVPWDGEVRSDLGGTHQFAIHHGLHGLALRPAKTTRKA